MPARVSRCQKELLSFVDVPFLDRNLTRHRLGGWFDRAESNTEPAQCFAAGFGTGRKF